MAAKQTKNIYEECKSYVRTKPDAHVTAEIAKEIGRNYRTLPTFEKGLYDHIYVNHYSIHNNKFLKCRWKQYKKHIEEKVFTPFQFPCNRDLHFYNCGIRFLPSESIYRYPEYRMKLKPGPGVDFRGQMPIPQESIMKRGAVVKEDGGKVVKKNLRKKIEDTK